MGRKHTHRLLYSSMETFQLQYGCVCVLHTVCWVHQRMYCIVWTYVESNSVLVADDDTTSAVSPTRRGAHEKTYGMRNRRRNINAPLEVWMLWLGCRSITNVQRRGAHGKTYGMRNRRRNVNAPLEVWMLWLGCRSITTVHGACV